jgi:hypothetical protein
MEYVCSLIVLALVVKQRKVCNASGRNKRKIAFNAILAGIGQLENVNTTSVAAHLALLSITPRVSTMIIFSAVTAKMDITSTRVAVL